jgi:hypothetical protein
MPKKTREVHWFGHPRLQERGWSGRHLGRRVSRQGKSMSTVVPSEPSPRPPAAPETWGPLLRLARLAARPLERFLLIEAASGILLLVAAGVALVWANSPWAEGYLHLWHTPLGNRVGSFSFERTLEWFVNDALMVIFFFVVGLEIHAARTEIPPSKHPLARKAFFAKPQACLRASDLGKSQPRDIAEGSYQFGMAHRRMPGRCRPANTQRFGRPDSSCDRSPMTTSTTLRSSTPISA